MERHVVITGASGGIGKVVLKHLLENGYTVYAACRDSSRLKEFSDYMPGSLHPITLDMESLALRRRILLRGDRKTVGMPYRDAA